MAFRLSTGAACRQSFNILSFSCNANRTKSFRSLSERSCARERARDVTGEGGQWRHSHISSIPNNFSHLLSRNLTIAVLKQSKQETFRRNFCYRHAHLSGKLSMQPYRTGFAVRACICFSWFKGIEKANKSPFSRLVSFIAPTVERAKTSCLCFFW